MIAKKFAAEGCNVAINYNASKDRAEQVAEEIKERSTTKAIILPAVSIA